MIKRIYDDPTPSDGYRVLVDRLWPRGISKDRAKLDLWLKDVAPSAELRDWFGHQPERFEQFTARYEAELADNSATSQLLALIKGHETLTLLYSAHNTQYNQAQVLLKYLKDH